MGLITSDNMKRDKEYAIAFVGRSGLDEIGTDAKTLAAAQKLALSYFKAGAIEVTVKLYQDGDLQHQWDLNKRGNKWKQYE